jgi:hypothetical protein
MPPEMMVGEVVGQGSIGVLTGMMITWLREWAKNSPRVQGDITKATVFVSHFACLLSSFGMHWVFEGDLLAAGGGDLTIHIPDVYHVANALILYGSNLGSQKTWALVYKGANALSVLAKAAEREGKL